MDWLKRAQEVIDLEAEGLRKVRNGLGDAFTAAVGLILGRLSAGGKIVVTGIGKNLHIAEKISSTLASTGATSVVLHPAQAMHGDLGILGSGDVLLALSYSGTSEEILNLIPLVRRLGVAIVALTGATDSPLARNSDAVINVAVDREACPFNMAPTASTTATLAVGDALAMVLLEARGFGREDYAKLHPGGAIGRALLTRVADIMRTGDRVARTGLGATVKDAVVAMTQARSGSAAIVDAEGRLLGIFTDGDLRRAVSLSADVLSRPVAEFMTRSPLSVRPDELAVDVLHVFERHDIDDIPVLDDHNRVVGTVDIVDLPKMKIM
jgi:arabinose-5-phosphate isomerase